MAFLHGKGTKLLLSSYDVSPYFTQSDIDSMADTPETTTFGVPAKTFLAGIDTSTVAMQGLFDGVAGAIDSILQPILGVDANADTPFTMGWNGLTPGGRVFLAAVDEQSYQITTPVAGVVATTAALQGDGPTGTGISLKDLLGVAGTGLGAGQDNGALTNTGGIAHLHVTANSLTGTPGSIVFKVQHSVDNITYVDLVTFASVTTFGVTGITSQRALVASGSTINRWLRASWTFSGTTGGSITAAIGFART